MRHSTILAKNREALRCLIKFTTGVRENRCPLAQYRRLPIDRMVDLARYNKVGYALYHVLSCPLCRRKITARQRSLLRGHLVADAPKRALFRALELQQLQHLLRLHKIRAVFFKDFRAALHLRNYQERPQGSDIDMLVWARDADRLAVEYRKRGYRVVHYPPKEYNAVSPRTQLAIDIQKTIAYRHYGDAFPLDQPGIDKLTALCLSGGKPYLSLELLLITQVVRFWSNNFARGLRQLQDIAELSLRLEHEISWRYVQKTLDQLGYYSRYVVILLVAQKIFGYTDIPAAVRGQGVPLRLRLAAWFMDETDVSYLENFTLWHNRYSQRAKRYYMRYVFYTFLSDTRHSIFRLVRPRLLWAAAHKIIERFL